LLFGRGFHTVSLVLWLYGCEITHEDADRLVEALLTRDTASSNEAAAAIRFGSVGRLSAQQLEPDLRQAILGVLEPPPPGLADLRRVLARAERKARVEHSRRHRLVGRVHNPRGRTCLCLSDCWCRRTWWGSIVRWYVPARRHTSIEQCWDGCHTRA
jgi:hypothetical protein